MTNIVQVNLLEDKSKKRYTYLLPEFAICKKGDIVLAQNKSGDTRIAICVTDSERLSANAIDMIMEGRRVISNIIGFYRYEPYTSNDGLIGYGYGRMAFQ